MFARSLDRFTILVPVDFDDASRRAAALAVEYARALGGHIVLLHVIPPTTFPEGTRLLPVDEPDPVDIEQYVDTRARRLLDEHFASVLTTGAEVRMEARSGHPVETILRAIDDCGAAMVVMGTHGRAGAARLMLGSTAEGVARRSRVPVMIVRQEPPAHNRAFPRAAALSGAVAGAATGAIAGPVGAVAGVAVGAVVGAVAGTIIAREDEQTSAHDRELDNAIGVTRGSLGTPPETKQPTPSR
jgi:nucleotide-binding universal stress UspA family protein